MKIYCVNYNEYGIYNGKYAMPKLNREEKRKYIKEHKRNKNATRCPECNYKTIKLTDDNGNLFCEFCGKIIRRK